MDEVAQLPIVALNIGLPGADALALGTELADFEGDLAVLAELVRCP